MKRLLSAVFRLFESLLVGLVGSGEIGAVISALLALALKALTRTRTEPREKEDEREPAVLAEPSQLSREVRRVIERSATGPVSADVVRRATMGVEFVAGIEAEHPGSIAAFTDA